MNENDCLSDPFITHNIPYSKDVLEQEKENRKIYSSEDSKKKRDRLKNEKRITDDKESENLRITLHYFENNFDSHGNHIVSTYNTFEMTKDFLQMITNCGEIIPNVKVEL